MTAERADNPVAVVTGSCGATGAVTCKSLTAAGFRLMGLTSGPLEARPRRNVSSTFPIRLRCPPESMKHWTSSTPRPRKWTAVLDANLRSAFQCSQQLLRHAVKAGTGGSIVTVASVSGQMGSHDVAYGASKVAQW
jgi:NAD(P)-dependent dehydrogenase (short-subunit alcohol dehydrogenase family)